MKKLISIIISLALLLTMIPSSAVSAASTKLTSRETSIIKAYVSTIEHYSLSYINKYKYPGKSFKLDSSLKGLDIKLISPKYSKAYDSKVKLYCLYASGIIVISDKENIALGKVKMGVNIKTKSNTVYAYSENTTSTTEEVIEVADLSASQLDAVEEYLTDEYGEKTAKAMLYPDQAATASIDSPVPLGETHVWTSEEEYLDDKLSGTYALTVTNVEDITFDDLEDMGFERPDDNDIEYKLVTVEWEVREATLTQVDGDGEIYINNIAPDIFGSMSADGGSVIGGRDYGFDGCLSDAITEAVDQLDTNKLLDGETVSYTAEGNILLPIYKDSTSCLVIKNYGEEDYTKSKMCFSLE